MNDFCFHIKNDFYEIEKIENDKSYFKKPLYINIYCHNIITKTNNILEQKKFRRRIYNNIINILKLKDGNIKKYQVYNELELYALINYLKNNNILFRISDDYNRLYNDTDKLFFVNGYEKPEYNKLYNINIIVYKGFVKLNSYKDNSDKIKYKIYL
jgi:hypothetical protein